MPKSDRSKRNDKAVKIERDIAAQAKFIADENDTTIAEYLSNLLRDAVQRDFDKALRRFAGRKSRKPEEDNS